MKKPEKDETKVLLEPMSLERSQSIPSLCLENTDKNTSVLSCGCEDYFLFLEMRPIEVAVFRKFKTFK